MPNWRSTAYSATSSSVPAIGAPVGSYYPEIAKRLRTRLVIPPHADVCNAVGAVAGGVLQRASATITQPQEGLFRAHLATGIKDFINLEEAARYCSDLVSAEATSLATRAGAVESSVVCRRLLAGAGTGKTRSANAKFIIAAVTQ